MPAMSEEEEDEEEEAEAEADIEWGTRIASSSQMKDLYSSFFSEGVEYKLYDNVQAFNADNEGEPFIGKIMKLWEDKQSRLKKVSIRWFMRLRELDPQLEGDSKELFLAFGKGKGVTNENDLEVICGKSKVLCTSTDVRNRQPLDRDVKNADFYFSKVYNVDLHHVSPVQRVVDTLGCEAVYNKEEWISEAPKDSKEQDTHSESLPVSSDSLLKREVACTQNSSTTQKEIEKDMGHRVNQGSAVRKKQDTHSESLPVSSDSLLKREVACTQNSSTTQKDIERDMGHRVNQGSAVRKKQVCTAAEGPNKRSKSSASIAPQNKAEPFMVFQQEQSFSMPKNEDMLTKVLKVDVQKVQSKSYSIACRPPQTDGKVKNPCGLPEAVEMDGQSVQRKLDFPASVRRQTKADASNLGESLSFKKISDAVEKPVTNANNLRQLTQIKSLSKEGQNSQECAQPLAVIDDALESTVFMGSRISRQLVEINTKPKKENILPSSTLQSSLRDQELILKKERDLFKPVDSSLCSVNAETNLLKQSLDSLKVREEAESTAMILSLDKNAMQDTVSLRVIQKPKRFVQDPANEYSGPSIVLKRYAGTRSETEKQSITAIEPRKEVQPWKDNLQDDLHFGKVLLLQNLDPYCTSSDLLDMFRNIFQGISDVLIVPHKTDCPHGQALAVFDSRLFADSALQMLEKNCLVMAISNRPIIASKFKKPSKSTKFPGHLASDKFMVNSSLGADDYKRAVSTSHASQPNTIEYEMAMEWRRLQQIIQTCCAELFEKQKKEIEELRASCCRESR